MIALRTMETRYGSMSSQIHYLPLRNYFIKYPLPLKIYVTISNKIVEPLPLLALSSPKYTTNKITLSQMNEYIIMRSLVPLPRVILN